MRQVFFYFSFPGSRVAADVLLFSVSQGYPNEPYVVLDLVPSGGSPYGCQRSREDHQLCLAPDLPRWNNRPRIRSCQRFAFSSAFFPMGFLESLGPHSCLLFSFPISGGLGQLTKALSNEWAKHNVQVNAIAPGYISTDM